MKHTRIVVFTLSIAVFASADDATLAHQRAAMADIRTLAMSIEAYATDHNRYPDVSAGELAKLVVPAYAANVPAADPWGTPYLYVADGENRYRFVSAGADRTFEESSRTLGTQRSRDERAGTDDPNADLVFEDGAFIQYPAALAPKPRP